MKRRAAIQQLAILGSAVALFPACNVEEVPVFAKIPLEHKSWKTLRLFTEAVLPVNYEGYPTNEPRAIFILNILNNCTSKKDLESFLDGFKELQNYLTENRLSQLDKLDDEKLDGLFNVLEGSEVTENLGSFYHQTKALAKQHFTTCERFMKEEMDYRFIPEKYQGNVDVHTKII